MLDSLWVRGGKRCSTEMCSFILTESMPLCHLDLENRSQLSEPVHCNAAHQAPSVHDYLPITFNSAWLGSPCSVKEQIDRQEPQSQNEDV